MFAAPPCIESTIFTALPDRWRKTGTSTWADHNKHGKKLHSFLEGPCFDGSGNLYVVDIPWGRIFSVSPQGEWRLVLEYDGWPNGLKFDRQNRLYIADYKRGILRLDLQTSMLETVAEHLGSERLKGPNDLYFATNGDLWFTDQGQTGMTDPTGRIFRLTPGGQLQCLSARVPSPNGIVLNQAETAVLVATRENAVWSLPLHADVRTSKVRVFIQFSGGGGPDGLAMDVNDGLTVCHAGLGAVWCFSPRGEPTLRINSCLGASTTNLAYGGTNRQMLFITESETGSILCAPAPVPGRPLFSQVQTP